MTTAVAPSTRLPSGETVPVLGLGTWHLAEDPRRRKTEITALQLGIDLGMSLIDTAEMYGNGASEQLVGEAIAGRRDEVFLVSKVLPNHASRHETIAACEGSLRRLRTDHLDLYLLHWRGPVPLEQTVDAFTTLMHDGKIKHWGVSNFDVADMDELTLVPGGGAVTTDQVLYNLAHRGIEWDLLPWCRTRHIPIMAYSPIQRGRLLVHPAIRRIAVRHDASPAEIALAWVIRQDGVIAIPQAGTPEHVREDHDALDVHLTKEDLRELNEVFPPPTSKQELEVI
jgi:diketogulonate reductase-like aldo/keto reductase